MKKVQKWFCSGRLDDVVRLAFTDEIYFILINKKLSNVPELKKENMQNG